MKFNELTQNERLLKAIDALGFTEPSQIQEEAIPKIKEGKDILAQSQTGTGKTVAYAIPTIENVDLDDTSVQALIVCPTRELALQVAEEYRKLLLYSDGISVVTLYGGDSIVNQMKKLKKNPRIVVGTPGRLNDHIKRKTLKLSGVKQFILDEADEMLKMGFSEEIHSIYDKIEGETQNIMFSATMPKNVEGLAAEYLHDPEVIKIEPKFVSSETVKQTYVAVKKADKKEAFKRIIDHKSPERAIVFCNTKKMVDELTEYLRESGYSADKIHGDLRQEQRSRVMAQFNAGSFDMLVATDIAGRGIDVKDIDLVINYDMPDEEDSYVHRIGRSGRAGKDGEAVSIVSTHDKRMLDSIQKYIKKDIAYAQVPSQQNASKSRTTQFIDQCTKNSVEDNKDAYRKILADLQEEGYSIEDIALALLEDKFKVSTSTEDFNDYDFFKAKANKNKGGRNRRRRGGAGRSRSHGRSDRGSRSESSRGDKKSSGKRRSNHAGRSDRNNRNKKRK